MRDTFIFYRSFYEAIKDLPDKDQLLIFQAISEYSLNHKEIELTGIAKTVFILIKPNLEANYKRFVNGSRPKIKQKISKPEAKQKQKVSKIEANKDKDKDKDNNVNKDNNKRAPAPKPKIIYFRTFDHLKITNENHQKLIKSGYTEIQVLDIYNKIQNYKKNTNYKDLYLTALNWLKKEYSGEPSTKKTYVDFDKKQLSDADYDNDPFLPPLNPTK